MDGLDRDVASNVGFSHGREPQQKIRGQMNSMDEGAELTELGLPSAHRRGHRAAVARGVAKRGMVVFLAFAMAFSTTPAQMWADGAEGIAEAVTQTGEDDGTAVDSAAEQSAAVSADAGNAGADSAAGSESTAAGESSATSAEATSTAAQGAGSEPGDGSAASASTQDAAAQQSQENNGAVAVQSLSSSAKVYIQDSKDKNSSWSTKSGTLKVGDVLWANMYDGSSSAANPGTWTYTWLAGSKKSGNAADYTEVVGHDQSLAVTDAMAGKYFICKVTADGKDYYSPAKSYGEGVNSNYIPGPVLAAGQVELYKVELDKRSPSVGDTLTATAYTDHSTKVTDDINVSYTWSYADSSYGPYTTIEGATGDTLELAAAHKGKYIKVEATAGVNTESAKTSDPVLAKGAVKLAAVELKANSTEIGATLTARAYTGSSYSPTYVDNSKVTYTWKKYKGSSSPSYSTSWETIEGESGPTLTVTDNLEGCYVTVSANAGANDVSFGNYSDGYGVGPFKQAGAVDIYSVMLAPAGSTSGSYVYCVGDTVQALAKEKGASDYIDDSKLNFQWQQSDTKNGTYVDIAGATASELKFNASFEGKFVKCVVSSKIGSSTYASRATNMVAKAGSVNITSVKLSASDKVNVGDTLMATAKSGSSDVTDDEHVAWSWYTSSDSGAGAVWTKVDGVTGNTLDITQAYLGKYIKACADGGYGDESATAGPVVEAGAVTLHHVELSGTPKVGNTLTAAAYVSSYTEVSSTDKVHYQWQYADSKTTSDTLFKNIEGAADAATYTVTTDMVGKYIRVKATSDGSVVSTIQKSYYGSTSVDPLGPVTLAGQYELSAVEIKDVTSAILQVGRTVTPQAKISSGYYDKDAPADAKLTYTWYAKGADDADWTKVTDGVAADGTLTIGGSLADKSLRVEAYSLANTVAWTSGTTVTKAGEYNLRRVITTPQATSSNTHLIAGDAVTAEAQSIRADGSTTNGIKVTDGVTFAWYVSDSADGEFSKLDGVDGASVTVPDATAGKYLKVVATSGTSSVETTFANKVIDRNSIDAVVQKLNDASVKPSPVYGEDTNINDVLEAKIAKLGFEGVTAQVKSVDFSATDVKATVGISAADDKTNGDVTFFYMDPNDYSGYNFDGLRRATVTFELTKDGKTAEYKPGSVTVPWDEDMLQQRLDNVAADLAIGYASGDTAESVMGDLTLPYRAGSANKYEVTWESSSDQVKVGRDGWEDYTGKVTRAGSDRDVTLTATVKLLANAGGSDTGITGSHIFDLTVKGDPQKVAADKKALQAKVDAGFTYDNVKYSGSDTVADKDGLTDDLQMPRTSVLGIDGKYYDVKYTASTDDITFNGYRGTVYRPEPGKDAAATKITLTVTDKSNPEIAATKTLDYTIAPQSQDELDNELWYMQLAKSSFYLGLLDGQDVGNVTQSLHAPVKVYGRGSGVTAAVNWCYSADEAEGHSGIVPVELDGYDSMGSQGWRLYKSSKPSVIAHENLVLTQPEYNTKVTITARLSSEKYARYAERYPDNEDYAALANQDVSATVTVKGSSGQDNPNAGKTKTVTAKVTGVSASDASGNYSEQTVAPLSEVTVPADEDVSAETVLEQLMKDAGCTDIEANAWGLTSAKMSDGRVLGTTSSAPYSYWSFYVNGNYASVGAPAYYLKDGDFVEFRYVKGDGTQVPGSEPSTNPSAEHPEVDVDWNGYANGGNGSISGAPTPTTATANPSWASDILTEEQQNAGASATASDPLIIDGDVYMVTGASIWGGKTWNARLAVFDGDTGELKKSVDLATSMDSTCRPVYADGIIVIPLAGGALQAVSAKTLETIWYVPATGGQSLSSLTVDSGYVYAATLLKFGEKQDAYKAVSGAVRRYNLKTGALAATYANDEAGYYWAGGVVVNGYYVVGDDSGCVKALDANLSVVSSVKVADGYLRTALVEHDGYLYAVSRDDGVLHKLLISSTGELSEAGKVAIADYSTSTPTFSGNYAFIGGRLTTGRHPYQGVLSIVNLSDMSVEQIKQADGKDLSWESKSTPLVSVVDGETYVYFTLNGADGNWPTYTSGGGVYMYRLGDEQARLLFDATGEYANYCMASIAADSNGNLFYTNDSGHLFCIKATSFKVKLDAGVTVETKICAGGSKLSKPADPVRKGYTFCGWFTDAACQHAYDFDTAVTSAFTLYAKWTKNSEKSEDNKGGNNGDNDGSANNNGGKPSQASSGTAGKQAGGTVPAAHAAVSSETQEEKLGDSKSSDDQKSKKDSKDAKKSGRSVKGSGSSTSSSGATRTAKGVVFDGAFGVDAINPWAIAGIAVGVVGLALIAWFMFGRRKEEDDVR